MLIQPGQGCANDSAEQKKRLVNMLRKLCSVAAHPESRDLDGRGIDSQLYGQPWQRCNLKCRLPSSFDKIESDHGIECTETPCATLATGGHPRRTTSVYRDVGANERQRGRELSDTCAGLTHAHFGVRRLQNGPSSSILSYPFKEHVTLCVGFTVCHHILDTLCTSEMQK